MHKSFDGCALARCAGKFLEGYTDLHPGHDCVAAWPDPQQLCRDMIDNPVAVLELAEMAVADFETIDDHFDAHGLFLWIATDNEEEQTDNLKRVSGWT